LALLVIGSFVLLTVTYGRGSDGVQRGVSTIFSPVQSVADRALKPARDLVNWFDETFDARGENSRLKTQLDAAREQGVGAQAALAENAQLLKLVGLDRGGAIPSGYDTVTARVTGRNPSVWYADVTIDAGSSDGIAVEDPVVGAASGEGAALVGTISAVTRGSASVELIADHGSRVGAKVVPGGAQGVLKPEVGDPGDLILDFLNSTKLIGRGSSVVTSGWRGPGIDSRYPPNLRIGEVVKAPIREQEASQLVHVKPYADLRSVDIVQVLTGGSRG